MNWNDNVNTQNGSKVKLADFIKTASGASDLVSNLKVVEIEQVYEADEEINDINISLGVPDATKGIIFAGVVEVVGRSDEVNVWTGIHYASRSGNNFVDHQDDGCDASGGSNDVLTELIRANGKIMLNVWYGSGSEDDFKKVTIKAILFLV